MDGGEFFDPDMSVISEFMPAYDTLDDPAFDWGDRDELLHIRSALEFIRDTLSDAQKAELDTVDAHWQADATAFNAAFGTLHHYEDQATALDGFVTIETGQTPKIPADHWWWNPIVTEKDAT